MQSLQRLRCGELVTTAWPQSLQLNSRIMGGIMPDNAQTRQRTER
jgi:hypothetical protein